MTLSARRRTRRRRIRRGAAIVVLVAAWLWITPGTAEADPTPVAGPAGPTFVSDVRWVSVLIVVGVVLAVGTRFVPERIRWRRDR